VGALDSGWKEHTDTRYFTNGHWQKCMSFGMLEDEPFHDIILSIIITIMTLHQTSS